MNNCSEKKNSKEGFIYFLFSFKIQYSINIIQVDIFETKIREFSHQVFGGVGVR